MNKSVPNTPMTGINAVRNSVKLEIKEGNRNRQREFGALKMCCNDICNHKRGSIGMGTPESKKEVSPDHKLERCSATYYCTLNGFKALKVLLPFFLCDGGLQSF